MKVAYFDCPSGISGDMILGAWLDAGLSYEELLRQLSLLPVQGFSLNRQEVRRGTLRALRVEVRVEEKGAPPRSLSDFQTILAQSTLPLPVKERAGRALTLIAEAEAKVHGVALEEVHFHELGGLDTLVDVVGAAVLQEMAGVERVYASPLPLGTGCLESPYGLLPLPAPAVLELLRGVPVQGDPRRWELVTPTGAAILRASGAIFGPCPAFTLQSIGYGAGQREGPGPPNLLRLWVGEMKQDSEDRSEDEVLVLEANLDDMNPEFLEHVSALLIRQGAWDVAFLPAVMKRGRPGVILRVLAPSSSREVMQRTIFQETTTLGLRWQVMRRARCQRTRVTVTVEERPIRVKVATWEGKLVNLKPEYEDCRVAAEELGLPLKEIWHRAEAEAWTRLGKERKNGVPSE